uniref:Succinate dehydrogenase subunit 3 n=1 Tax=Symphyocladiella dendroidea TaxID=2506487 RepID=UPI0022FD986B|nr:Succinate dehydrogenase subunit 3 [Symphyocladiella dendroidea]WAX04027.1 Succinate dehydrogenase subunit 3 [Symphyocladiella dendroidea]
MLVSYSVYSLKPFSPHLTIYLNQLSSIFSIIHRFSALFIIILFFCFICFYMFLFNLFFFNCIIFNYLLFLLFSFCYFFILKLGTFHLLNGLKIIFWNFTYFQNFKILNLFNKIIGFFFLFFLIFF